MKRLLSLLMVGVLLLAAAGCGQGTSSAAPASPAPASSAPASQADAVSAATVKPVVRIGSLKGPTSMGLVSLMQAAENNAAAGDYRFTMTGTADELVAGLSKGTLDIVAVPANLSAVLYNNTKGAVAVGGINTLGVLYVLENGENIHTFADLAGKTVYSTGKGTTPEYALNYLLAKNGLDPAKDLTIEFLSESTEGAALLASTDKPAIVVLPQPYVTSVLMQNSKARVALSFTDEWQRLQGSEGTSQLVTGVYVIRRAFLEENQHAVDLFLKYAGQSAEFAVANVAEAAALCEKYGIVAKAAVAEKALPACNIVNLRGEEMKAALSGYLSTLYEQNPKSVGGTMPDDAFYYLTAEEPAK